jgi:hypothetical protein
MTHSVDNPDIDIDHIASEVVHEAGSAALDFEDDPEIAILDSGWLWIGREIRSVGTTHTRRSVTT